MMKKAGFVLAAFVLAGTLVGCWSPGIPSAADSMTQMASAANSIRTVAPGEDFVIHILHEGWNDDPTHLTYTVDESWPLLSTIDLGHDFWDVKSADIETYDWANQVITLTKEASTKLDAAVAAESASIGG